MFCYFGAGGATLPVCCSSQIKWCICRLSDATTHAASCDVPFSVFEWVMIGVAALTCPPVDVPFSVFVVGLKTVLR